MSSFCWHCHDLTASAYSHPPSFELHPNAYVQTTTAYRRTPLSLDEQLSALGKVSSQLGVREYYSVYQWDWDYPHAGKLTPAQLRTGLRFFHDRGVTAVNAEASNNWAARGLGYYLASQLMWDISDRARVDALPSREPAVRIPSAPWNNESEKGSPK